ncbi:hypothetical protein B0J18DRAFT_207091 [Chaetomium sp. MPI-SDFR-AT-0129]|nr:hypothetical protein B0J18DRAFT_207091 [Chaetomium sp. MPI-SDFR-AT-0129]
MSSTYSPQYYATGALPIPPSKPSYPQYHSGYTPSYYPSGGEESTYSVSPPEGDEDLDASVSSGTSGSGYSGHSYSVGTLGSAAITHSHYAGSGGVQVAGGEESVVSASGVDLNEYMQERFAASFDPLPLDKCTAKQAQTSGHLNAKHRELLELQAKAQARLAKTRARFAQGLEDAREVHNDLEWTQKKVASLKTKASKKHTKEYAKARARYPSPDMY